MTVCLAGGEREVGIAGYGVRMARKLAKPVAIEQITIERQCDNEFIKDLAPAVERPRATSPPQCRWLRCHLATRYGRIISLSS